MALMFPLRWLSLLLCVLLAACAHTPDEQADRFARQADFNRLTLAGSHFNHRVYSHTPATHPDVVHVYIEGDGNPWIRTTRVAADPTPRNPLALRLMALDPAAAVYLGRPCYFGLARQAPCTPADWTHGRYSERVLDSMAAVLRQVLDELGNPEIVFIGYSGGGNLAMLLAPRFERSRAVITLAANLDHVAWTRLHDYSPLHSSRSAAAQPPLPDRIEQLHLAGAQDNNIPANLIRAALRGQPAARLRVIPSYDHRCCWEQLWPDILAGLTRQ